MTHWLGLDLLFVWLVKRFLFWMVRAQVQPESRDSLSINPDLPVCYVLKNESLADYLVMARECINLELPDPSKGLKVGNYQHKRASYFLTGKGWIWERREKALAQPHYGQELVYFQIGVGKRNLASKTIMFLSKMGSSIGRIR